MTLETSPTTAKLDEALAMAQGNQLKKRENRIVDHPPCPVVFVPNPRTAVTRFIR